MYKTLSIFIKETIFMLSYNFIISVLLYHNVQVIISVLIYLFLLILLVFAC